MTRAASRRSNDISGGVSNARVRIQAVMLQMTAQIDEDASKASVHFAIFDDGVEVARVGEGFA